MRVSTEGPGWLKRSIDQWEHCLQFTPPRGSLRDVDALITELSSIFLKEREQELEAIQDVRRNRRDAIRIATNAVREAVEAIGLDNTNARRARLGLGIHELA